MSTLNTYKIHLKNNDEYRIQKYQYCKGCASLRDLYYYYYDDRKYNLNPLRVFKDRAGYKNDIDEDEKIRYITDVINWTKERLIGIPYKWVYMRDKKNGNSYYKNTEALHSKHKQFPNYSEIKETGINCIGLINLIRLRIGLTFIPITDIHNYDELNGSLSAWHKIFTSHNLYTDIESQIDFRGNDSMYKVGTLFYTPSSYKDSGHIAIYIGNGKILHAYPDDDKNITDELVEPGVKIDNLKEIDRIWAPEGKSRYFKYFVEPECWLTDDTKLCNKYH
jgi:cell wall-associated NlpC family hydrolase